MNFEAYDYREALRDDIKNYIDNYLDEDGELIEEVRGDKDEFREKLYDELWTDDSVTGNGSGSYTFDRQKAIEYLAFNFDLLADAIEDFGGDYGCIKDGPEACDVTIRCYLLGEILDEVLDEYEFDN